MSNADTKRTVHKRKTCELQKSAEAQILSGPAEEVQILSGLLEGRIACVDETGALRLVESIGPKALPNAACNQPGADQEYEKRKDSKSLAALPVRLDTHSAHSRRRRAMGSPAIRAKSACPNAQTCMAVESATSTFVAPATWHQTGPSPQHVCLPPTSTCLSTQHAAYMHSARP